jgi:kynurenine formamidase
MIRRIIDLSKPIQYLKQDPWFMRVKIRHKSHKIGHWLIRAFGLPARLFPKNFTGWADDTITRMGVHSTTHLDAPWHYGPLSGGQPAKTIDEIPLEWCFSDGVVVDMTHKADHDPITVADIKADLEKTGARIVPGTIVLIRTGRDRYMGTKDYWLKGTGMSPEATEWLIDQGVKVMGIDQWGWDTPLKNQITKSKKDNDSEVFWAAHRVGIKKEYCHIEQLVNLGSLPPSGFMVSVLPLKIVGGSAAPARVVAILEE